MNPKELGQNALNRLEKVVADARVRTGVRILGAITVAVSTPAIIEAATNQPPAYHIINQQMPSLNSDTIDGRTYTQPVSANISQETAGSRVSKEAQEQKVNPYDINKIAVSGNLFIGIVTTNADNKKHVYTGHLDAPQNNYDLTEIQGLDFIPTTVAVSPNNQNHIYLGGIANGNRDRGSGDAVILSTMDGGKTFKTFIDKEKKASGVLQILTIEDGRTAVAIVSDRSNEWHPGLANLDDVNGIKVTDTVLPLSLRLGTINKLSNGYYSAVGRVTGLPPASDDQFGYWKVFSTPQGISKEQENVNLRSTVIDPLGFIDSKGQERVLFVSNSLSFSEAAPGILSSITYDILNDIPKTTIKPNPLLYPWLNSEANPQGFANGQIETLAHTVDTSSDAVYMATRATDNTGKNRSVYSVESHALDSNEPGQRSTIDTIYLNADEGLEIKDMQVTGFNGKKFMVLTGTKVKDVIIDSAGNKQRTILEDFILVKDITKGIANQSKKWEKINGSTNQTQSLISTDQHTNSAVNNVNNKKQTYDSSYKDRKPQYVPPVQAHR